MEKLKANATTARKESFGLSLVLAPQRAAAFLSVPLGKGKHGNRSECGARLCTAHVVLSTSNDGP